MNASVSVQNSAEVAKRTGVPAHWPEYFDFIFSGLPLVGSRVLDVGSGVGIGSVYAASAGAREVCSLEPETAGSQSRMVERAKAAATLAGVSDRIRIDTRYVHELTEADGLFDVILIHNAINHFDEKATTALNKSSEARTIYRKIFADLRDKLTPGGALVIADCSPRNFFWSLGLRNPFARSIEPWIHQTPGVWASVAREAGFGPARVRWTPVRYFGPWVTWATANGFVSFFLKSHFVMHLRR